MTKITPEHLARNAIVYVRQSSPYQVMTNLESQRRQYALVARGQQLGWSDVQVIDDDLVDPVAELPGQVSKNCWRAFAKAASARFFQLRHHDSRAMVEIGIRSWSSVD